LLQTTPGRRHPRTKRRHCNAAKDLTGIDPVDTGTRRLALAARSGEERDENHCAYAEKTCLSSEMN